MEEKTPERGPNKRFGLDAKAFSNLLVVLAGILFYVGLTHFGVVRAKISSFLGIISPFIAGFVIAYLLNTPMSFFERTIYRKYKHRRVFSILTVYAIAIIVLALLLDLILPQVVQSIMALAENMSVYLENLNTLVQRLIERFHLEGDGLTDLVGTYQDWIRQATTWVTQKIPELLTLGRAVGSGVVSAITALIASVYMLAGKGRLVPQLKKLVYAFVPTTKANRFLDICRHANGVFSGFINGKLIDSAIIGVLCFLLNLILRIPFPVLVAVVIGVTNIIPFFGPIIGAVPCIMILLVLQPWAALRFGIMVIVLQQFDGNILGPKILGDSTGLSPIWVLVAIIVGGGLFDFMGMVLGVPTFAVIYMLVGEFVHNRLAAKGIDGDGRPVRKPPEPPQE